MSTTTTAPVAPRPVSSTSGRLNVPTYPEKPIWEIEGFQVEAWIRTTHTLFPKGENYQGLTVAIARTSCTTGECHGISLTSMTLSSPPSSFPHPSQHSERRSCR